MSDHLVYTRDFLPPDRRELQRRASRDFGHVIRRHLLHAGSDPVHAAQLDGASREVLTALKGSVPAQGLSDDTRAFERAVDGFLSSLSAYSAFDRLLPSMRQLVPNTRTAITTGITGDLVAEGRAIPVSALGFDAGVVDPVKVAALVVTTKELARLSESTAALNSELASAVARASDIVFVDALLDGVTVIAGSGNSATDVDALLAAVETDSTGILFFLVATARLRQLANERTGTGDLRWPGLTATGGFIAGVPAVPSDALSAGMMMLVDARQLAGWGGTVELAASGQADILMDTLPAMQSMGGSPSSPIAALMTSMYQTNSVALRCVRSLAMKIPLRPAAIAAVSSGSP